MQRFGTVDCRHFYDRFRVERQRIHFRNFGQLRGQVNFLHQVEVIVAPGWAIGPEPNGDTGSAQLRHGRNAARDHHVARRVVHASHLPLRQSLAVCAIHKNAVC